LSAPRWPDDWDGVGFVESVTDFDLAAFRPHPPGYPVYVALLRVAAFFVRDGWRACVTVAVASGGAAVAFAWASLRRVAGEREAWVGATLLAVAPLTWRVCSGVGSEAPALACALACGWALAQRRDSWRSAIALGVAAGIGLGVRLSWAPLFVALLAMAPSRLRGRAIAVASGACLAWALPLVALVGPARLYALCAAHFAGHAERWGGTVLTAPGLVRFRWLGRDLFVDGLGLALDPLGIAMALLLALAFGVAFREWRTARWLHWEAALVASVPYAVWVFLGQNLRDQPRHVLPLVVLVCAALAFAARNARAQALLVALSVLVAFRSGLDAWSRRSVPPAGQQLVDLARAQPSPERLAVFGVASVRFFETTELSKQAFVANGLGDAEMALTRVDRLPSRVWVTSEVGGLASSRWPVTYLATLCRPARIDRRAPCLDVYEWKPGFLPKDDSHP
jgi:hypothetical protein